MKKSLLVAGLLLSAVEAFAGVCGNGSLAGYYNYQAQGVRYGDSGHSVGRIYFNGKGSTSFLGIETSAGAAYYVSGSGTYSVSTSCVATGSINWTNGSVTTYWLYLDQMDYAPAVNVAYHGNLGLKNNKGFSASGTLDRKIGKF